MRKITSSNQSLTQEKQKSRGILYNNNNIIIMYKYNYNDDYRLEDEIRMVKLELSDT
jgi:hypothetical protein